MFLFIEVWIENELKLPAPIRKNTQTENIGTDNMVIKQLFKSVKHKSEWENLFFYIKIFLIGLFHDFCSSFIGKLNWTV